MQVRSEDRPSRPIVHFQAPEAARIETEMNRFLAWFDDRTLDIDPVIKAAVAHIWFETIHPFDDGNGRIGRAIMDLALARAEGTSQRFYSMSARLRAERNEYYETLEAAQKGDLDIIVRIRWLLRVLGGALDDAEARLNAVLYKAAFWAGAATPGTNDRQSKILNRLLDGFEGKFTSSKYAKIAHCSQDTALRDIEDQIGRGLMVRAEAGGRSTSYRLRRIRSHSQVTTNQPHLTFHAASPAWSGLRSRGRPARDGADSDLAFRNGRPTMSRARTPEDRA